MRIDGRYFTERPRTRFEWVARHLPREPRRLLNLGNVGEVGRSATAKIGALVSSRGGIMVGCDLVAPSPDGRSLQVTAELPLLPFRDGAFEVVYMGELIEHFWDPLAALREVRRVTTEGGWLILDTPSAFSVGRILNWYVRHIDDIGDADHKLIFTPAFVGRLLDIAGYEILDMATDQKSTFGPFSLNWLPGSRRMGPHILVVARSR